MAKRISILFVLVLIFGASACISVTPRQAEQPEVGTATSTEVPTETQRVIPTLLRDPAVVFPPIGTATPEEAQVVVTEVLEPTVTLIPTETPTPTATFAPTPFPTLVDPPEYPFNTTGMTTESSQRIMLTRYVLWMNQEAHFWEWYDIPRNPDLNGFPLDVSRDFPDLTRSAFCRYFNDAQFFRSTYVTEEIGFSLDFSFVEAQTLIGIDCAYIDISMFPPVTH